MKKRVLIALALVTIVLTTTSLVWADGVLVDSVQVQGKGYLVSSTSLNDGTTYWLCASGTYVYWSSQLPNYGIADAEYSLRPASSFGPGWVLGEDVFPEAGYPHYALDVRVDGQNVDWGAFNIDHTYAALYVGTGSPARFSIWDSNAGPPYSDNSGYITVDIYDATPAWMPPISLEGWTLNENATLPIKFHLYRCGELVQEDLGLTLTVNDEDAGEFRFDSDGNYYIFNWRPGVDGTYMIGVNLGTTSLGSIDVLVEQAGTPNGRGRSK
jgi:hypothetical protein